MNRPLKLAYIAVASVLVLTACTGGDSDAGARSHEFSYTLTRPDSVSYGEIPEPQAPSDGSPIHFTLGSLSTGPGTDVAYYSDRRIGEVAVPGLGRMDRVVGIARHGDGWVVAVYGMDGDGPRTLVISAGGEIVDTYAGVSAWPEAAASSGGSVAYATSEDTIRLDDATGAEAATWTVTGMNTPHLLAVTDDGSVVVSARIHASVGTFTFHADGSAPDEFWGIDAWAASGEALASPVILDAGVCPKVSNTTDHAPRWVRCGIEVVSISPGGKYMAATGRDYRDLILVDAATGHDAARFAYPTRSGSWWGNDLAWEDATHVVVFVSTGNTMTAVRLGVDGARELVGGISGLPRGMPNDPVWEAGPPNVK